MNETPVTPAPTDPTKVYTTFTNSAGQTFSIHGLSPVIPHRIMDSVKSDFIKRDGELPSIPTYEVVTVSGEKEIHEHDEKSLMVEGDPEQTKINQDAWKKYQDLSNEMISDYNSRIMKSVLMTVQAIPTKAWRDEMKFIGIELPAEGSQDEKYLFIETNVIRNHVDLSSLTLLAFQSAGIIKEEMTAEVEATFRDFMEGAFIEAARNTDKRERLESNSILQRGGDGSLLEQKAV